MSKIAFLFPGQGSQHTGMGSDFFKSNFTKELFEDANFLLGFDITSICLNGPEEDLALTENTQPAILLVSAAALKLLTDRGVKADWAAGHSLGEYTALLAAGAISFEDAIRIVNKRGKFMQDAAPVGSGAMAAILGLGADAVDKI